MDKVFVSGGGTGGHFYPALSVSKVLKQEGLEVVFIGTENGIEAKKELPFGKRILFKTKGVRGKSIFEKIKAIFSLLLTTLKVYKIIKKEKPKFCICFGGYASLPLGLASFLTSTPLYIHEQNSVPSYTNLILSKFAKRVFITFKHSLNYFPKEKTILTGLPMREEIVETAKECKPPESIREILVVGGSQGSRRISETILKVAEELPELTFHIVKGKTDLHQKIPENVRVYTYIDDIHRFYRDVDVVVSRAGSGVVNELLACGRFAVYIPYPYAASNHQYYNAKFLKEEGISEVIEEKDLTPQRLKKALEDISGLDLKEISRRLKAYARLDGSKNIVNTIKEELDVDRPYRTSGKRISKRV